jgi:hypothetical protein
MVEESTKIADDLTHFQTDLSELPADYYFEIGRAIHRWSQVEMTVCALAATVMEMPMLNAIERLRGTTGFKVKHVFEQLIKTTKNRGGGDDAIEAIQSAQQLYGRRNFLIHSVWGFGMGPQQVVVAIHEWTSTDYANFREVPLAEIRKFSDDCLSTWQSVTQTLNPLFHGSESVAVDDADGIPRGLP